MQKKSFLPVLALGMGLTANCYAADNPFADVPADHWAYDAVSQLAADNILEGYEDKSFRGNHQITRYEMAQMVAKARAKASSGEDKVLVEKLTAEFQAELEQLGVKTANLERNADRVKWSGVFAQKAMKGNPDEHTWWEKELFLNVDAAVNENWNVHAGVDTKWGSNEGWNSEEGFADAYGASNVNVSNMLYQLYAKGAPFKGAFATLGLFTPGLQEGFVGNARTKGMELDYQIRKTSLKAYGGNLHEKVSDMSSAWSDAFRRHGNRGDFEYVGTGVGGTETGVKDQRLRAWGLAAEQRFTDCTTAGIGYYNLHSPVAYGDSHLGIVAVNLRQRLADAWELSGFYSHGNQHYQNKAYDVKFIYNGSPWGDKKVGGSFGYRYLGSDALIMSSVVNGSEKPGRKGWEASLWYHFMKNIQIQGYLFNGTAINKAYDNGAHRTAYFTSLLFSF
ncbi:S-layer homology domain-containing protein [Selenomonas sp.]|uniref:S-layer homology domain-containing protein n=1 Tax=Selenomonas sp. TaxID=2053611 RepID=UPI0025E0C6B5|nr:S-layer homology domain-containing protein [Selenomonas sp.]